MQFKGKVAVVSGAAQGIGAATAQLLAAHGAAVATLDLRHSQVAGGLGLVVDVADSGQVEQAVERIERELGPIGILVNVAGILHLAARAKSAAAAVEFATPNPFRGVTRIGFTVARRGRVTLEVFDASGRHVRTLVAAVHERGTYDAAWDGTNDLGSRVPAGTYLVRLTTPQGINTTKVSLLR